MTPGPRVLVTGASGLLGAEVTARLVRSGHRVTALVHNESVIRRNDGRVLRAPAGVLRTVAGDVTRPDLGLDDAELDGVDRVVHCAAVTDFGRPAQLYREVNVDGTRHVLDLARRVGAPLVHVGTAYVCGERDGVVTESELDVGQSMGNPYETSKLAAEQLVRRAGEDGAPVAVVRPSIVVGAARSGVVREFKNIYVVLRLTTQGRVRAVPGRPDATLDLVPVDYVADLVAGAARRFEQARGRVLHAVGGPLHLGEISEVLAGYPSFEAPRYVAPESFDPTRLTAVEQSYHRSVISLYESYFRRRPRFTDDEATRFRDRPPPPRGRALLRRILDHALRAGYLGPALPGVEETLSALSRRAS